MLLVFWVFKENSFASAIVTVSPQQQLIACGPYAWVRHPMYAGILLIDSVVPLALGSWWAFPFSAATIIVIVLRLLDEEKLLNEKLPGYSAYARETRYRLIHRVW